MQVEKIAHKYLSDYAAEQNDYAAEQNVDKDQDTVDAPSLNSFKNRLNKIRSTRMDFFMD